MRQYREDDHTNPVHHRTHRFVEGRCEKCGLVEGRNGPCVECIDAMHGYFRNWIIDRGIVPTVHNIRWMMLGFCIGNAFKYRWRKGLKPGESEDKEEAKARWYDLMALHTLDSRHPDPRDES